jgi:hypothetical protein
LWGLGEGREGISAASEGKGSTNYHLFHCFRDVGLKLAFLCGSGIDIQNAFFYLSKGFLIFGYRGLKRFELSPLSFFQMMSKAQQNF